MGDDRFRRVAAGWFGVADRPSNVADQSFSAAPGSLSAAPELLSAGHGLSSVADQSLSVADGWFGVAEKSSGAGFQFTIHSPKTKFPVVFDGIGQFVNGLFARP